MPARVRFFGSGGGGGPTPPPPPPLPYTPPLDAYPALAAYSVRKVSSSYTGPCIEIIRTSDNATQEIGFGSNGLVDSTEIQAFCSGTEGIVSKWFDQSSNGNHALQPLGSAYIYQSGVVRTLNGKPALGPINFANLLSIPTLTFGGDLSFVSLQSYRNNQMAFGGAAGTFFVYSTTGDLDNVRFRFPGANFDFTVTPQIEGLATLNVSRRASGVWNLYNQGNLNAFTPTNAGSFDLTFLFGGNGGAYPHTGPHQEIIFWNSDLGTAVLEGFNSSMNQYYEVGNFPDYTSGFLADYSGAAAAFSVRKLNNTAIKCMRVRRTVSPFDELDIGFDSNGDLDTDAIVAFGGGNPLVVSRWYDQGGQSNHAVQKTPGTQPQIYNGTEVLTDMGRPTLYASGDAFDIATISGLTEYTISYVARGGVGKMPAGNTNAASRTYLPWYQNASTALFRHSTVDRSVALTNPISTNQRLTFMYWDSNTVSHAVDGNTPDVSSAGYTAQPTIDRILDGYSGTTYAWNNNFQEIVIWNTDKNAASQRTAIETNVNDYFYVYNTSGFVVDYPNALTAYSVRQLGNRQRYAMRVRRLGGAADYLDVGFVSGELDTQAIIDFGGSDTLGVEVWYDQTKSGNDATNTDTTTMPIIYNGSSVITDGGKPALGRNSAGLYYSIGNIVPVGVTQASFISVVQGPDAGTLTRTWHGSGGGSLNSLTTGNNLYIYNGGSPQFGSGPAVGRTLGIQLTDGNPGAAEKGWRNGVLNYSADSGPNSPRTNLIGSTTLAQTPLFMQEMILYPSDIDAGGTRTNIELNINSYYGIY